MIRSTAIGIFSAVVVAGLIALWPTMAQANTIFAFADDFEDYVTGPLPSGSANFTGDHGDRWQRTATTGATADVVPGQYLNVTDDANGSNFSLVQGFPTVADAAASLNRVVRFAFDVQIAATASNARPLFIATNGSSTVFDVRFRDDGDVIYLDSSSTEQDTGINHVLGQWNHVEVIVDFGTPKSVSLAVNGVTASTFGFANAVPPSMFNEIQIWTGGLNNNGLFDNVLVVIPEPSTAALVLLAGSSMGLSRLRRRNPLHQRA
jgi:hypothetical protein